MKGNILVLLSTYHIFSAVLGNKIRKMDKIQLPHSCSSLSGEKIGANVTRLTIVVRLLSCIQLFVTTLLSSTMSQSLLKFMSKINYGACFNEAISKVFKGYKRGSDQFCLGDLLKTCSQRFTERVVCPTLGQARWVSFLCLWSSFSVRTVQVPTRGSKVNFGKVLMVLPDRLLSG